MCLKPRCKRTRFMRSKSSRRDWSRKLANFWQVFPSLTSRFLLSIQAGILNCCGLLMTATILLISSVVRSCSLVQINVTLLTDNVREAPPNALHCSQCKHNFLPPIHIGVAHTQNVLEILRLVLDTHRANY